MNTLVSNKFEVVMFTPTADGGHARYTQEVLSALSCVSEDDIDPYLVTSEDLSEKYDSNAYKLIKILPALKNKSAYSSSVLWMFGRFFHYIKRDLIFINWLASKKNVRIVHFQEVSPFFGLVFISIIRFLLDRSVVMTIHNIKPHKYPPLFPKGVFNLVNKLVYRTCSGVVVHSDKLKNDVINFANLNSDRVVVAPHGIWSVEKDKLSLNRNGGTVLFYGTIRENKGLHHLLASLPYSTNFRRLIIAGFPTSVDYYNNKILPMVDDLRQRGLEIEILDYYIPESEVGNLFSRSDVVALPYTDFSSQSGILFDAVSYELAVIASDSGALGETVSKYGIGETFSSFEAEHIAAAIDVALTNSVNGKYNPGFLLACHECSWEEHARVLRNLYRGCL